MKAALLLVLLVELDALLGGLGLDVGQGLVKVSLTDCLDVQTLLHGR